MALDIKEITLDDLLALIFMSESKIYNKYQLLFFITTCTTNNPDCVTPGKSCHVVSYICVASGCMPTSL